MRRWHSRRIASKHVALRLALLAATVAEHAAAQPAAVRDSAGVRIVLNPPRAGAPVAFRLGQPTLDIGGIEADPDVEFTHSQGYLRAVRLSDGRLAVIDVSRVHFFTPDGKRQKIAGRQGSGPEEFQRLTAICRTRGDTLVVSDSRNRRFAVLDRDGGVVRTILQADLGYAPFDFCFDDGTFLLERPVGEIQAGARTSRLTRVRLDGTVANVVGELPGGAFDPVTQFEITTVPAGRRIYHGDPSAHAVRIYSVDGSLLTIIRNGEPRVRITDAEAEERMASTIPTNVSSAERTERMNRMRAIGHAAFWPAFRRMHVDALGRFWLQDFVWKPGAQEYWTAYDADGRMLGRLAMPMPKEGEGRVSVIWFGLNDVLMRRYDEDRATHLTLYPILRTDRPRPMDGRQP